MGRHFQQWAGNALHTKRMAGPLRDAAGAGSAGLYISAGGCKHQSSGWTSGRVGRHGRVVGGHSNQLGMHT